MRSSFLSAGGIVTEGKAFRMTAQRRIILEEIEKSFKHPSAADIYEKVKKKLPHISLGTVYRNLEILSSKGMIKRLNLPSGQRRFDAGMKDHHHVRCISCGKVEDLPAHEDTDLGMLVSRVSEASGYRHLGFAVDFYGVCPGCTGKTFQGT
jgi:Fe2+ or Zn2+ uptake regulation protein